MKKPITIELECVKKSILIRISPELKIKVATKLVKDDGVSFQSICEKALMEYAK